jgi:hypothetical protein
MIQRILDFFQAKTLKQILNGRGDYVTVIKVRDTGEKGGYIPFPRLIQIDAWYIPYTDSLRYEDPTGGRGLLLDTRSWKEVQS